MRVLLTGGAGFIGSHLLRMLLAERPHWDVVNLDLLTYAGNRENLSGILEHPRHRFLHGDICDGVLVRTAMEGVEAVLNLAAETHVDRSIRNSAPFVRTNVLGTQVLLDAAMEAGVGRFLQASTDEVYGQLPHRDPEMDPEAALRFTERSPLNPRSPYSASKAAADLLALSYHVTHGTDVVIVRGSNNYGPRQHPEKLVPRMVTHALRGGLLPIYGDGTHVRDWIHVEDFCRGILAALEGGRSGEIYNFGGSTERTNLQMVRMILEILELPQDRATFVSDRPGHDRRYAMDTGKAAAELGWSPERELRKGLRETVHWYVDHRSWWEGKG